MSSSFLRFARPFRTYLPFAFSAFTVAGAIVACSAESATDLTEDTDAETPAPTASLPPPSNEDAAPPIDAGRDASRDAHADAHKDAAKDAAPPPPNAGDACAKDQELFVRSCGKCGQAKALCLDGHVTDYGPCENEMGDCVPGAQQACGNCGTQTCTNYCVWGACGGEPPSSCAPTSHDYTAAGCPNPHEYRTRDCKNDCTWTSYSQSCAFLDFHLEASATAAGLASGIFPLRPNVVDKRMTGTCPNGSFSTTTNHANTYVRVVNPTNQQMTASVWTTVATPGGPILDTVMAWYAGNGRPANDADRKACTKGVATSCPATTPCGDYRWSGMTGADSLVIPPNGSVLVWIGSYYPIGGAFGTTADQGDVKLVVRTDALE